MKEVFAALILATVITTTTFYTATFVRHSYLNEFSNIKILDAHVSVMENSPEDLQVKLLVSNYNANDRLNYIQTKCEIHDNLGYLVFRKYFTGAVNVLPSSKNTIILNYTRGKYLDQFDKFKTKCSIEYLSFEKMDNDFIDD